MFVIIVKSNWIIFIKILSSYLLNGQAAFKN